MKKVLLFLVIVLMLFGCTQENSNLPNTSFDTNYDTTPLLDDSNTNTDNNSISDNNSQPVAIEDKNDQKQEDPILEETSFVEWQFIDGEWRPRTTPPECPSIFITKTPVDVTLATSVLYPGQVRGGDYKPHGGFRFDNSENDDITVVVPFEGYVNDGARYLENGILQYTFNIVHPCGIMYRFDHLETLSPKFLEIAEQFREATEGDSRGTWVTPVYVNTGEIIALSVGSPNNTGMDFGVYDARQKNDASEKDGFEEYEDFSQAPYALCWLELLPEPDRTIVLKLPGADGKEGKNSEYCD